MINARGLQKMSKVEGINNYQVVKNWKTIKQIKDQLFIIDDLILNNIIIKFYNLIIEKTFYRDLNKIINMRGKKTLDININNEKKNYKLGGK